MRGSKYGIAAQAIGVLALIAIVYTAFLQPDDSSPPTGIEIEDGTTTQAPPSDGKQHGKSPSQKPRKAAKAAPGTAAVTEAALPPADGLVADTPAGAQYSDAVSRILDQLARAGP